MDQATKGLLRSGRGAMCHLACSVHSNSKQSLVAQSASLDQLQRVRESEILFYITPLSICQGCSIFSHPPSMLPFPHSPPPFSILPQDLQLWWQKCWRLLSPSQTMTMPKRMHALLQGQKGAQWLLKEKDGLYYAETLVARLYKAWKWFFFFNNACEWTCKHSWYTPSVVGPKYVFLIHWPDQSWSHHWAKRDHLESRS